MSEVTIPVQEINLMTSSKLCLTARDQFTLLELQVTSYPDAIAENIEKLIYEMKARLEYLRALYSTE